MDTLKTILNGLLTKISMKADKTDIVQSDWEDEDRSSSAHIKNKPNVKQSDWNQNNETEIDYIKNKPSKLSDLKNDIYGYKQEVILPSTYIDFYNDERYFEPNISLILGKMYRVKYNYQVYRTVCSMDDIHGKSLYFSDFNGEHWITEAYITGDLGDGYMDIHTVLEPLQIPAMCIAENSPIIASSTVNSDKKFRITVDDSGLIKAVEHRELCPLDVVTFKTVGGHIDSQRTYRFEAAKGDMVLVVWDGKEYKCSVGEYHAIGNHSLYRNGGIDTGEPFCILILEGCVYASEPGTHTLAVYWYGLND